jgi:hypothetical protein
MTTTEYTNIDVIEIANDWNVQVRAVKSDGGFHRWVLTPDDDISGQEQKVKDACNTVWTDEVRAAFQAFKDEKSRSVR